MLFSLSVVKPWPWPSRRAERSMRGQPGNRAGRVKKTSAILVFIMSCHCTFHMAKAQRPSQSLSWRMAGVWGIVTPLGSCSVLCALCSCSRVVCQVVTIQGQGQRNKEAILACNFSSLSFVCARPSFAELSMRCMTTKAWRSIDCSKGRERLTCLREYFS
jgi:hypothetical protein